MNVTISKLGVAVGELFGDLGLEVGSQAVRTNDEREWFCIRRYFEARLTNGHMTELGALSKSESPDFVYTSLNEVTAGIEVAEGTNKESQIRYRDDYERDEECYLTNEFDIPGDPALEWANAVGTQVRKKIRKINGPNWKNLDSQEILMYPNIYRGWFDDQRGINFLRKYLMYFRISPIDINGNKIKIHILFGNKLLFDFLGEDIFLPLNT